MTDSARPANATAVDPRVEPATPAPARLRVAVIAFDRISPFHLSVPCVVFGEDRSEGGVPPFELAVCAAEPGTLTTTAGFTIGATQGLEGLRRADVIVVPSWRDTHEAPGHGAGG